ncbi:MAG: DUF131 domain-containing protein [Sulfolobaceae archaeon]|nr:DUF131 domain-containing protein [Sulfolobaceae archaeon]
MKYIFLGFLLMFIGVILIMASSMTQQTTSTNGGVVGFVMIGPFPIVFGNGNSSIMPTLLTFALAFTIIALLFYLIPLLLRRKSPPY